jgi:hypothetical protein
MPIIAPEMPIAWERADAHAGRIFATAFFRLDRR